jgi:hypothetical protein
MQQCAWASSSPKKKGGEDSRHGTLDWDQVGDLRSMALLAVGLAAEAAVAQSFASLSLEVGP